MNHAHGWSRQIARGLAALLPEAVSRAFIARVMERHPNSVLQAVGPLLNRRPDLDRMPIDLPVEGGLQFEHLAGLFASTSLDHGVISMTVRQTAYLFGLVRRLAARTAIEIGRYKGGSTLTIAAAMKLAGGGRLWSVDVGEKEARLRSEGHRSYDQQIADICRRFGFDVKLFVGDSRTVEIDSGPVDLVFIDGDHSYEGVRSDYERFGRRARIGGALLFDDAFDEPLFRTHSDSVGRLVGEIEREGSFKLVKTVDRLAHLERVR